MLLLYRLRLPHQVGRGERVVLEQRGQRGADLFCFCGVCSFIWGVVKCQMSYVVLCGACGPYMCMYCIHTHPPKNTCLGVVVVEPDAVAGGEQRGVHELGLDGRHRDGLEVAVAVRGFVGSVGWLNG